VLLDINITPVL